MKEWLLMVWLGTTTNFTILGYHVDSKTCESHRMSLSLTISDPFVMQCIQDMREGRSLYPKPSGDHGLVK